MEGECRKRNREWTRSGERPLHSILPLPRRILHDPLRIIIPDAERALRRVVVSVDAIGVCVGGDCHGALQLVEVFEGGGAAAEGACGATCTHAVRAGAEDEGASFNLSKETADGDANISGAVPAAVAVEPYFKERDEKE